jgi:hypothetical protein
MTTTDTRCPQYIHTCVSCLHYIFITLVRQEIELIAAKNRPIMDTHYKIIKTHHCLVVPTTWTTVGHMKDTTLMVAHQVECASSVAALSAKMIVFQIVLTPLHQYMHAIR